MKYFVRAELDAFGYQITVISLSLSLSLGRASPLLLSRVTVVSCRV